MAKQPIDAGSAINAGDGEAIRNAFLKINQMMDDLYGFLSVNGLNPDFLANGSLSNAKLGPMAALTIKGNLTGVQTPPTDIPFGTLGTAMGAVLVGEVKEYAGPILPALYLWADGSTKLRSAYPLLLDAITAVVSGTTSNGNATISAVSVDLTNLGLEGAPIEGAGIQSGTTVVSVTSNTIVLSQNANANGSPSNLRIFPHGNGNGTTTFTLPARKGTAAFGRDNMGGSAASKLTTAVSGVNGAKLGATGGDQRMQQHNHGTNETPHSHPLAGGTNANGTGTVAPGAQSQNAGAIGGSGAASTGITIQNAGAGGSQNVPPATVMNFIIYAGA